MGKVIEFRNRRASAAASSVPAVKRCAHEWDVTEEQSSGTSAYLTTFYSCRHCGSMKSVSRCPDRKE
jgi:hypothetical protein